MSEKALIKSFTKGFDRCENILVGPGEDDSAVFDLKDSLLVQSSDMFIQGIHFPSSGTPGRQIGWHAAAANISDVVSMGANPLGLTLSLSVPGNSEIDLIKEIAKGANDAMVKTQGCVAGGDITKGDICIDCGITGLTNKEELMRRNGAKEGDLVCITGSIGGAAVGEIVLKNDLDILSKKEALKNLLEIPIRYKESKKFRKIANSAIDLSDGLFRGMELLSDSSGVGIKVEDRKIPLHPSVKKALKEGYQLEEIISLGGDYEILFTVPEEKKEKISFPVIGRVEGEKPVISDLKDLKGFEAFQ